jgi:cellulose 1,4-beta-cellobiosidase
MNAAIYLVSMDPLGNLGAMYEDGNTNQAGWTRGTGYCDAQCPTDLNFVQGLYHTTDDFISSLTVLYAN